MKTINLVKTMVAAALFGLLHNVSAATAEDKFIFAHALPEGHIFHPTSQKFMDSVKSSCPGSFKIDYHLGGDLGDWTSQFEQAMTGAIPMTLTFANSEVDGRLDVAFLGYIAADWETGKSLYGPGGQMEGFYNEILDQHGVKLLGTIPVDFGSIAMRKGDKRLPMSLPDEASGIKLRVPPMKIGDIRFRNLGFSAVPMPFSEIYTALELGAIDGRTFAPPSEIYQMRDVIESYILTRDYFEHAFWLVNTKWWNNLDSGSRTCLEKASNEAIRFAWADAQKQSGEWMQKIKDAGINIVTPNQQQINAIKASVYANEWPWLGKKLGPEMMAKLKLVAGIQ